MAARRSSIRFSLAITACAAVLGAGVWATHDRFAAARETASKLEAKRAEIAALRSARPAPTDVNAAAIATELATAEQTLVTMRSALGANDGPAAGAARGDPSTSADEFFEIAAFAERMRARAEQNGVEIDQACGHFAFSAYTRQGPAESESATVAQQRAVLERVLESLFAARPRAVVTIKREAPHARLTSDAHASDPPSRARLPRRQIGVSDAHELFVLDPRLTLRAPGTIDTVAVQIGFVSDTNALRRFLNRLSESKPPLMVRDVSVEPTRAMPHARVQPVRNPPPAAVAASYVLSFDASEESVAPADGAGPVRGVVPELSTFTLTIEAVSLIEPQAPVAPQI